MDNKWIKSGNVYRLRDGGAQTDLLPPGVYKLGADLMGFYLDHQHDSFKFSYKVYGMEKGLVSRVCKTFSAVKDNIGVLLSGIKGSGKTVTAKRICNELKLPVIIVAHKFDGVSSYINDFQQEAVFFFDEYEKIYDNYNHEMLSVMDGVMSTQYKKLFILTTNETYVNSNMLQRPGRIRYFKTFDQLPSDTILEIIDDLLIDKSLKDELIKFISELETITVDIVKCIVEECNIHNEGPENFKDVFNVSKATEEFNVFEVTAQGQEIVYESVTVNPKKVEKKHTEKKGRFYVGGRYIGKIIQLNPDSSFVVEEFVFDDDDEIKTDEKGNNITKLTTFKVSPLDHIHDSFYGYAF